MLKKVCLKTFKHKYDQCVFATVLPGLIVLYFIICNHLNLPNNIFCQKSFPIFANYKVNKPLKVAEECWNFCPSGENSHDCRAAIDTASTSILDLFCFYEFPKFSKNLVFWFPELKSRSALIRSKSCRFFAPAIKVINSVIRLDEISPLWQKI